MELREYIQDWCVGKSRWWRIAILLALAWEWKQHVSDPLYSGWFSGITLGIHEGGHLLFRPFGDWLMIAGGSIAQTAAPIIAAVLFLRQPDFFAISVCGGWLSTSLFNMATYMSDAVALEMDVVTIGGADPITPNDWRYLLQSVGLLLWDQRLAQWTRAAASLVMLASLLFGAWLLLNMGKAEET